MSQLMTALTATAVRAGDPNASTPSTMSATPHKIDHVEACRTISDGLCCVIEASSMDGQSVLLRGKGGVTKFRLTFRIRHRHQSSLIESQGLPGICQRPKSVFCAR